jgi:lysyl-tRNA synthetase class 2
MANKEARERLINRCKIVSAVRHYFDNAGYLEVETPFLQMEAGGAAATPFVSHYNAYETDVKLRISLELYLKRLICGDISKVYEIGRVFRNEGVSYKHNPEFTLLEFYEAYSNLEDMMVRVEQCFLSVATEVFKSSAVEVQYEGTNVKLDFGKPWNRVHMLEEIAAHTGTTPQDFKTFDSAVAALNGKKLINADTGKRVILSEERNLGGLLEKLLEVFVEPTLIQPTFVVGYPLETSPLAKKDAGNPGMTRRFEGYVLGKEVCNAFSEINDPIDQRERFEFQLTERDAGQEETHPMDEEFIYALECGMPPTGGCGIGLDRMAMLLTGAPTVRETLFFPFMRPHHHGHEGTAEESKN